MDGITETEVEAIDNLAYIAQSSESVAGLTVDMSWFADGIRMRWLAWQATRRNRCSKS